MGPARPGPIYRVINNRDVIYSPRIYCCSRVWGLGVARETEIRGFLKLQVV